MPSQFEQLIAEQPTLAKLSQGSGAESFFAQEALRFISIAGTLLENGFLLDGNSSADGRHLTHVLARSLLENYFTIIYLFDDPAQTVARYEELKNTFKDEYRKLLNEPMLPDKGTLEPADPSWKNLRGLPNVNSMLAQVRNVHGDRLDFLYFIYRIGSFDTHDRSSGAVFEAVFGKKGNFPILKVRQAFDYVANEYLVVLGKLRASGTV
jgi:hypothetical protein